jgi:biotin carboxylase
MSHVVLLESSRAGIQVFEIALRKGIRTTLVTSGKFDWLYPESERQRLHALATEVVHVGDSQDAAQVEAALRDCHRRHPVDAVFSTLQMCVYPAAAAAHAAGLRGTRLEGIRNARDKARCRELLAAHGVASVRHALVHDVDRALAALKDVGYPAIIKPTTGVAKLLTTIVHGPQDVIAHFEQAERERDALIDGLTYDVGFEFIVEQLAVGPLFSIEAGIGEQGEWMPLAIVRRKTARANAILELGSTIPSGLSDDEYERAADYAHQVARALGLGVGMFHIEFIFTREGPRLVEVNPRIAGGTIPDLIRTATNVNLFEVLLDIHLGKYIGLRRLSAHTACSQTYLCAADDCTVRPDLPADWFEQFRGRIVTGRSDIAPGKQLKAHRNNFGAYGIFSVTAPSYESAREEARRVHGEIMSALELELLEE